MQDAYFETTEIMVAWLYKKTGEINMQNIIVYFDNALWG